MAAGKVSKFVVGVSSLKLNLRKTRSPTRRLPHQEPGTGTSTCRAVPGCRWAMCLAPLSPWGDLQAEDRQRGPGQQICSELCLPGGEPSPRRPQATYCPPNSCMPSSAKTTMKRNSRKSRLTMDFMELSRDTTRFRRELQYLSGRGSVHAGCAHPPAHAPPRASHSHPCAFRDPLSSQTPHLEPRAHPRSSRPLPWGFRGAADSPPSSEPAHPSAWWNGARSLSTPNTRAASGCLHEDHKGRSSCSRRLSAHSLHNSV